MIYFIYSCRSRMFPDAHPELKLCQNMSSSIDNNSQDDEEKKSPNSFEKKEGEEVHCIYVYV